MESPATSAASTSAPNTATVHTPDLPNQPVSTALDPTPTTTTNPTSHIPPPPDGVFAHRDDLWHHLDQHSYQHGFKTSVLDSREDLWMVIKCYKGKTRHPESKGTFPFRARADRSGEDQTWTLKVIDSTHDHQPLFSPTHPPPRKLKKKASKTANTKKSSIPTALNLKPSTSKVTTLASTSLASTALTSTVPATITNLNLPDSTANNTSSPTSSHKDLSDQYTMFIAAIKQLDPSLQATLLTSFQKDLAAARVHLPPMNLPKDGQVGGTAHSNNLNTCVNIDDSASAQHEHLKNLTDTTGKRKQDVIEHNPNALKKSKLDVDLQLHDVGAQSHTEKTSELPLSTPNVSQEYLTFLSLCLYLLTIFCHIYRSHLNLPYSLTSLSSTQRHHKKHPLHQQLQQ